MPRLQRSLPALTAGVAALGIAATVALCGALTDLQQRNERQALDRRVDLVRTIVGAEAARYVDVISDIATALGAQTDLSRDDFHRITAAASPTRLSGLTGVSMLVEADTDEVAGIQSYWRGKGATDLTLRPDPGEREHVFAVFGRYFDGRPAQIGRDLIRRVELMEALRHAANSNAAAVSRTYVLTRDEGIPIGQQQLSFALAAPFYRPDATRLSGWVVMGMRGGTFLTAAMERSAQNQVEVALLDSSPTGIRTPVARWPESATGRNADLTRTVAVGVAQRTWQLTVTPTRRLIEGSPRYLVPAAGAAGALITALVVGIVLILGGSRGRALAQVAAATAALQADIVRREETERQLRRSEAELRGFLAMAGHDLRSPLAATAGHVEMIKEEYGPALGEQGAADLLAVERGLTRMARLVEDLLAYATADAAPLSPRPLDLRELAAEIAAESPADIEVDALPRVLADPKMLRHVLENLIGNAVKYTPPGTRPQVTISGAVLPGGPARIEVADRGIGIPDGERDRVFEAFHRSGNSGGYPGTGLGLAICQRIVERHGGEIGVDARPGGGSVFWFTLPAAPQATRASADR